MFQYSLHISGECNFSSFFEWELRERRKEGGEKGRKGERGKEGSEGYIRQGDTQGRCKGIVNSHQLNNTTHTTNTASDNSLSSPPATEKSCSKIDHLAICREMSDTLAVTGASK